MIRKKCVSARRAINEIGLMGNHSRRKKEKGIRKVRGGIMNEMHGVARQ